MAQGVVSGRVIAKRNHGPWYHFIDDEADPRDGSGQFRATRDSGRASIQPGLLLLPWFEEQEHDFELE
ncbi:Receptor-Type Tyrosine-Protein Phosphatase T [Manis pentadactyla]|nr:Receptor-Type Tyrosine-Protein Phosphatase T [Manis pentadactyla]